MRLVQIITFLALTLLTCHGPAYAAPAGRRHNDRDEHRGENVMNAPDTILYCGLFTTLLVAALIRNGL